MKKYFLNLHKQKAIMRTLLSIVFLFFISFTMIGQREVPKKSGELKLESYKLSSIDDTPKIDEPNVSIGYKSRIIFFFGSKLKIKTKAQSR